ncbi:MAG: acylphosphatase [bacterium]
MKKSLLAVVHGRVQGVGFRDFLFNKAQLLEIRGWARNLTDGTVETMAQGSPLALERFLQVLKEGPIGSRVDSVQIQWAEESVELSDFKIRG